VAGRHVSDLGADGIVGETALGLALAHGRHEEEGWRARKDGTRFWGNVVLTAIHDEDGRHIGFGTVGRDLTARRLGEEQARSKALELEAANRQLTEFQRLVSSVRDYAIFMLDTEGNILSWNTGARRLKGYEPDEAIGRHFSMFYTDADRDRDHPAEELAIAQREGSYEEEGWRVRKDGTTFWASVVITAVRDDTGRLTGFAKVTRDLTPRKEAEEALLQAVMDLRVANEELDRFAAVAAHDLTDPLRTITGFAELLEQGELGEAERAYAQHIRASGMRLSAMLDGLLTYARAGQAPEPAELVRLDRAAGQVIDDLAASISARGARIDVDLPADAAVATNAGDIRVVLQNLISNAVKFADPRRPEVRVSGTRTNGSWRVTVQDNGEGIAQEDRERIFGAFERAGAGIDLGGYGLGLAICHRLVDRYGGSIGVESDPPNGSTFWFTLPAELSSS
jgi:PAS domain S-box-containing protein